MEPPVLPDALDHEHPYDRLTPDCILSAVESQGFLTDARILGLNSYENRVYQIGIEDKQPLIAKFYRPHRWSDEQILEEHRFTLMLSELGIPVVPPIINEQSETLFQHDGFRFALYQRQGGHSPELENEDNLVVLGRFLGRIHAAGSQSSFVARPTIDIQSYGFDSVNFLLGENLHSLNKSTKASSNTNANSANNNPQNSFNHHSFNPLSFNHPGQYLTDQTTDDSFGNSIDGNDWLDDDESIDDNIGNSLTVEETNSNAIADNDSDNPDSQITFIPEELRDAYMSLTTDLLQRIQQRFSSCHHRTIQLHGDCHPSNILWRDNRPHFVDFDDARNGPAAQDLWMLLSGSREQQTFQLAKILEGYTQFHDFDLGELQLIESLRSLRIMQYAAWLGRRWSDPAFPKNFPWFNSTRYWSEHILELREQLAAIEEPTLDPEKV